MIINFVQGVFNKGTEHVDHHGLHKRIRLVNQLILLILFIELIFIMFHFAMGRLDLAMLNLCGLLCFGVALGCNFMGLHVLSRSLTSTFLILIPLGISSYFNSSSALTIVYLPIIASQFMFHDITERPRIIFFIGLSLVAVLAIEITEYNIVPGLEKIGSEHNRFNYFMHMGVSLVSLVFSIFWLVTENYNAREKLMDDKEEAEKASDSKTQFLSMMSHEIRTPLNGIVGITEILMREDLSPKVMENVKVMKLSADNLLHIVNDILDLSKIEAGKVKFEKKEFDLSLLLEDIEKTLSFRMGKKNLQFETNIDPTIPKCLLGDSSRLQQVLINLLDNSIKFTKEGKIEFGAELISEQHGKTLIEFSVKDSGIGIPRNQLEHIFDSFTQASVSTTREYGGTGLGITISKNLIQQQGGQMKVDSKVGKGTSFSFQLAYSTGNPEALPKESSSESHNKLSFSGLKLLLVEDNLINQFVTKQLLQYLDIKYSVVNNGMAALEMLQTHEFDIVLMDYHMPIMDGLEAVTKIRDQSSRVTNKDIPIILVTADVLEPTSDQIKEAGANGFLHKPFDQKQLINALFEIVATHAIELSRNQQEISFIEGPQEKYLDIGYIEKIIGSDIEFIAELLQMVSDKTPELIREIKNGIENKNKEVVHIAAHNLKSNFKNIGMFPLSNLMAGIELQAKEEGKLANLKGGLMEFEEKYLAAQLEITTWLKQQKAVHV